MGSADIPPELISIAGIQRGLVTRRQLTAAGISPAALRHRALRSWRHVLPGVVALFTGTLAPDQLLVAAQLMCGPDARVSGGSAARWHGITAVVDDGRIHMQVPVNQASRGSGFVIVTRSRRIAPAAVCDGIVRLAPLPRAVADAVRAARSQRVADAVVIEALQRKLVRPQELEHELGAGRQNGSGILRRALATARTGAWSVAEVDLLDLVATSQVLPAAWPNPELRAADGTVLPAPDAWFDDVGLAVQVHSAQFHSSRSDWDRTVRVDSIFAEYGISRLAVTPHEIQTNGRQVLERIERAHLARAGLPRPDVIMTPRGPGRI
ncbi:hypothetical protein [Pengzhenrongella sp.]|jgi:hypothetical protein|uniref:hypothetical protein n=1 Tax=Pengzhenrongella sp. TaxID=2888820 RepID=UPI002F9201A2